MEMLREKGLIPEPDDRTELTKQKMLLGVQIIIRSQEARTSQGYVCFIIIEILIIRN